MKRKGFCIGATVVAVTVLGVALVTRGAAAVDGEISIVFPSSNVYVTQEQINVVGLAKGTAIREVKVAVKGGKIVGPSTVPVVKGAFICTINLREGINQITVNDAANSGVRSSISVFLQTEKNRKRTPQGFNVYHVHSPLKERHDCEECHNLQGTVPSYRRMRPSATCTTGDCHQEMGTAEFVHGPVAGGTCVACHNPHGSKNRYHRSRTGAQECYMCHEGKKTEFAKANQHAPVADGDCVACHDPHQAEIKFQLKAATVQDLCFTCHDRTMVEEPYLHGPVAAGACVVCHNPHASDQPKLWVEDVPELCFMCHEERRKQFERKFTHKPVTETCLNCHRPHGSSVPMQLKKNESELCLSCHEELHPEVAHTIQTAKVSHPPVAEGKCVSCHTPHSTDFEKQLKTTLKTICFECHAEKEEQIKTAKYLHGPVQDNDCYACHNPHGSDNAKILKKYFPAEFYTPYATEKYAICFDCHNKNIALNKLTTTETNFRNGSVNLHFVHVNKDPKGRSCKACHEVHAGDQEKRIREEVPFGSSWSYPISYTKLETGGRCVVGCHKPRGYDRVNPVVN